MLRRAHENKGILTKLEKEKTLLKLELKVNWKKIICVILISISIKKEVVLYYICGFYFIFLKSSPAPKFRTPCIKRCFVIKSVQ